MASFSKSIGILRAAATRENDSRQIFHLTVITGHHTSVSGLSGRVYSAFIRPISSAIRFEYALDQLPSPAFTADGMQSIIQHVAHSAMGSGTGC
jgi:hypothetical protein